MGHNSMPFKSIKEWALHLYATKPENKFLVSSKQTKPTADFTSGVSHKDVGLGRPDQVSKHFYFGETNKAAQILLQ